MAGDRFFVGRAIELSCLEEALEQASAGRPQLVFIEGEPGIGKTVLVDRFLADHEPGVVIRRARAEEMEKEVPFALLGQILDRGRVAPPGAGGGQPQNAEPEPLAAGAELLDKLGVLQQGDRTVVLVVDDVQFADTPSSVALVFTVRRLLADRALVVLTARPGTVGPGWSRLLSVPGCQHFSLGGLRPHELRDLAGAAGARLSEAELMRLGEVTDGHPLYALAVLSAGAHLWDQALRGTAPPAPPPPLAELVVSRLRACESGTQDFVAAACVLGRSCGVAEAVALAGGADAATAIDEAVKAGIFAEPGSPALRLRFVHALVHGACYQSLGRARRAALHRRAAELTTGPSRLHHRLAAVSGADEPLSADLASLAASELKAGALIAAAEHLRQAADVSPPGRLADRRLLEAIEAWLISGEANRALSFEERARAAADGPYRDHVLAYLALVSGRLPEAEAGFRRAWDAIRSGAPLDAPADLAARVAVCMAVLVVVTLDAEEMLTWSEAVRATVSADPASTSFAWFCVALPLGVLGRAEEALKLLRADGVPGTADVLTAKGLMEMWSDDLVAARDHLAMAFARSRGGETVRVTQGVGFLAECEYRLGLLGEASVHSELAVDAATEAGRLWDLPLLHSLASYPAAALGLDEVAAAHARAAADWAALLPIPAFRAYAAAAAVALALAQDDTLALLEAARSLDAAYRVADAGTTSSGPVLAEALVRSNRLDEAEEALADFESRAGAVGRRSALLGAARVRGVLEAARGDRRAADEAFALGARLAKRLDLPLEVARLAEAHGRYLLSTGRPREGVAQLEQARAAYERIGAAPYLARARHRLSELEDVEPGSSLREPAITLTATEATVAHLVAAGRSNKQIAAELVVSVKTVEYHLSNIYRRLGVTSRVKLAQLVGEPSATGGRTVFLSAANRR